MTRLRQWLVALGGLTLAGSAWGLALVSGPEEPFGPATYRKVRLGMSRSDVREAIGMPPGNYGPPIWGLTGYSVLGEWGAEPWAAVVLPPEEWFDDRHILVVGYRPDGTAVGCRLGEFHPARGPTRPDRLRYWLDRVRARLGL